jgi:ABC-type uncharacterized transport system permease subunit
MDNNYIFTFSAIVLYLACSALLFFRLKRAVVDTTGKTKLRQSNKQIIFIGFAALCLHGFALYNSMVSAEGINLGFYNSASLISAVIALFTLFAAWRHPVDIIAVVFLPVAALFLLIDSNANSSHLLSPSSSNALIFHILTSLIAYSLLALAALQAVLLSVQNSLLHSHQTKGMLQLMPPLKDMEVLLFELILVGFIALTISLGSGLIFLENMFAQQLAHKTILSILAWFVFLTLLIGHWKLGWRGRTAIRWTLSGFVSLMLAYFGSKFVLEVLLK